MEKLVGDVKGLIHALDYGEQGVVLVGHDWGGNIAWYAAHMLGPALIKVSGARFGCVFALVDASTDPSSIHHTTAAGCL